MKWPVPPMILFTQLIIGEISVKEYAELMNLYIEKKKERETKHEKQ